MTLTVVSTPAEGGDVTSEPASANGAYYPDDNVTLTAVPAPGYDFVSWTGDVSEIDDAGQSTIVVNLNRYYVQNAKELQIVANFARHKSFPWKWLAVGVGGGLLVLVGIGLLLYRLRPKAPPAEPSI